MVRHILQCQSETGRLFRGVGEQPGVLFKEGSFHLCDLQFQDYLKKLYSSTHTDPRPEILTWAKVIYVTVCYTSGGKADEPVVSTESLLPLPQSPLLLSEGPGLGLQEMSLH